MNDLYQTRQFFDMKKTELKQIIKEEVRNVISENTKPDDSFLKELTLFAQKGEELLKRRQENGFKK